MKINCCQPTQIVIIGEDIAIRKHMELLNTQIFTKKLIQRNIILIIKTDKHGDMTMFSSVVERISGHTLIKTIDKS